MTSDTQPSIKSTEIKTLYLSRSDSKQLLNQHYQLHIANQTDAITVRCLQKCLLRINRDLGIVDILLFFGTTMMEISVPFYLFNINFTLATRLKNICDPGPQNVSGYVCNHGSPSGERDTASPRGCYGERRQRDPCLKRR